MLSFIDEACVFPSVEAVVFSGGECFLLGPDLAAAVRHATEQGLVARCVTNGYWAKDKSAGRRILGVLREAGLTELNVSTGDFHQEFISEETVVNAVSLGVEMSMTTVVVIERRRDRGVTRNSLAANRRVARLLDSCSDRQFRIIESPWMPMDLTTNLEQDSYCSLNSGNLHVRTGCHSIFTTIVASPRGGVGLCCGLARELIPELSSELGDSTLSELLEATSRDFMKIWLFVDGPEKILAWASEKDSSIRWEDRYAHKCHACLALYGDPLVRSAIRKNYRERVDDVLLRYSILLQQQERLDAVSYA